MAAGVEMTVLNKLLSSFLLLMIYCSLLVWGLIEAARNGLYLASFFDYLGLYFFYRTAGIYGDLQPDYIFFSASVGLG